MSRHTITSGTVEAVLGWDPPLNTYFAQVWDRTQDEDDPAAELLWIGCMPGEIHDVGTLCDRVSRWVAVPVETIRALHREAHA